MLYSEKLNTEKLNNEIDYIFKNITEKNKNKLLNNFIKLLFDFNNIKISITTIKKTFNENNCFSSFIFYNICNGVIKNTDDLKFYILNEINLIMPNNEYLYNRFLLKYEIKDICKEFNNNFEFKEIEY